MAQQPQSINHISRTRSRFCILVLFLEFLLLLLSQVYVSSEAATPHRPSRILVDTDVDEDDIFAILYLLKNHHISSLTVFLICAFPPSFLLPFF